MKRGLPTSYNVQYPKSYAEIAMKSNFQNIGNNHAIDSQGNFRQNHFGRTPDLSRHRTTEDDPYRVTVKVGEKEYSGQGLTLQSAKHNAATK